MDWPLVSIVICTLNCRDYARRCLQSIRKQDYPQGQIEILVVDSYSTDGTIEVARELGARVILTEVRGYMEGKGMPKSMGCAAAKGDIVITIDSDNAMVETDWLKKMVTPLMESEEVDFCICRQWVAPEDPAVNRYVSMVGTDPFAGFGSMDFQLALQRVPLEDKGNYWLYRMHRENFLITGGYYLTIRRKTLESIGGYSRDVDVTYGLACSGQGNMAIVKDAHLHHSITRGLRDFIRKKIKWGTYYMKKGGQDTERVFQWMNGWGGRFGKANFVWQVIKNLLLIPGLLATFRMLVKDGRKEWWLHSPMLAITTWCYIVAYIKAKRA